MNDETKIQELTEKYAQTVKDLRAEYDAKLKDHIRVADWEDYKVKTLAREKELNDEIARIKVQALRTNVVEEGQKAPVNPEHTKAFFQYVKRQPFDEKALVSDATGNILIPEELEPDILQGLPQLNIIRQIASVRTMTRNRIRVRRMTPVTVGWGKLETGALPPTSTPVPSEAFVYAEDLTGLAWIGRDELADSDQNIAAWLGESFSIGLADKEEAGFAMGKGHTVEEPVGVFTPLVVGASATLGGVATVNLAAAGAVIADDIKRLVYAVPPQYRPQGVFLMHSNTELALQLERATTYDATHFGAFIWQPSMIAGRPATLMGYPVYNSASAPQVGDGAHQNVAAFGDFKRGYQIVDREGMSIQRLVEAGATAGLIGYLVIRRVTGSVRWADALRILTEP